MTCRKFACAAAMCVAIPVAGHALETGTHDVFLETGDGERTKVAELVVENGGYQVNMAEDPFTNHFLSMRPFKCLEGPDKHWCHVPYPYANERQVGADVTDIEYDFLFVWKGSNEYGINMWNGVYYQIEPASDGSLVGTLHEMDMDILSAPPDAGNLRPIREVDLEPSDPDSHWLPRLIIE